MIALTSKDQRISRVDRVQCPVCFKHHGSDDWDDDAIHAAAHCCLWKYVGEPVRTRIAQRIERGANWLEALEAEAVSI